MIQFNQVKGVLKMAKINKRRKIIFDMLKSHPQGLNGEAISQQLGVSSRTIRSDIKALQDALEKYNIRIFSSPTKGYRFIPSVHGSFSHPIHAFLEKHNLPNIPVVSSAHLEHNNWLFVRFLPAT